MEKHKVKHITLLCNNLKGGGAERMMVNLANGLVKRGIKVDFLLGKAEGPYLKLVDPEVTIIDLQCGKIRHAVKPIIRYLRKNKPQIKLTTQTHVSLTALLAKKLSFSKTRLLFREASLPKFAEHQGKENWPRKIVARLSRALFRLADGYIGVSKGATDDLINYYKLPEEKVHLAYNPVVSEDIEVLAREPVGHKWFSGGKHTLILGMGRILPVKDFETLIRAFQLVKAELPDAKLLILGGVRRGGGELKRLKKLVKDLNLDEEVDFPGFVENPFAYLSKAALFVLSSRYEGLPGSLIQAMACSCPVISTKCPGGASEILDNGAYGPLVEVGNYKALAQQMLSVIDNPPPSERLLERADYFNEANAIERYLQVFNKYV